MKNRALTFAIAGLVVASVAGITAVLILTALGVGTVSNTALGAVFAVIVAMLVGVMIVEIVSAFKIEDSTFHTALLAGCLVVLYACSTDMLLFFDSFGVAIPKLVFGIVSEAAFLAAAVACCWYVVYLYGLKMDRKKFAAVGAVLVFLFAGYSLALPFGYGYIAHFVAVLTLAIVFCFFLFGAAKKDKIGMTTYFTGAIFGCSVGVQSVNTLFYSGLSVAVSGISLVYAVLSFSMFLCVYLVFSIRTDVEAVKSGEYRHRAKLFETKALSGQIKPHFFFNSLEAVRALYRQDLASGDAAVSYLSNFLRGSINAFDSELIPFEREIDVIYNYTEFENLKRPDKIEIIFDIDFTDFSVPPFSIETFVENALKHSGVAEKADGRIVISSYKSGETAVVEISDNGKGFDPEKIPEGSHGIKNASGRFALALGAACEIRSAPGEGTNVKIVIDLKKQGGEQA